MILENDGSAATRTFTRTADFYSPDCDNVPYPVPASGAIEGETGFACAGNGDCHLIVVERAQKRLYEMWRANITGPSVAEFRAGCVAVWDLSKQYGSTLRGKGCTAADAGGFPMTAMLATSDEVAAGRVGHALRFILPNDRIRDGIYVPPGTHSTGPTSGGPETPPYGVRFRLKASFDTSGLSAGAKVLAQALKTYGMFLADGGNIPYVLSACASTFEPARQTGWCRSWPSAGSARRAWVASPARPPSGRSSASRAEREVPSRRGSLGRMKRSAWPTRPAATSSDVASMAGHRKPPASAAVEPFSRSVDPYCFERSQTAGRHSPPGIRRAGAGSCSRAASRKGASARAPGQSGGSRG